MTAHFVPSRRGRGGRGDIVWPHFFATFLILLLFHRFPSQLRSYLLLTAVPIVEESRLDIDSAKDSAVSAALSGYTIYIR